MIYPTTVVTVCIFCWNIYNTTFLACTVKMHPLQLRYRCKSSSLSGLYRSPLRREDMGLSRSSCALHLRSLRPSSTRVRNPLQEVKSIVNNAQPTSTHGELTGLLLGSHAGTHSPRMD